MFKPGTSVYYLALEAQLTDRSKAFERAAADCVRLEGALREIEEAASNRARKNLRVRVQRIASRALQPSDHEEAKNA